ncbi:MAG: geranylgeranyl reductase family protein [Myxococcales bacterium]
MTKHADCIVVGAGPAGSAAALHLARAGVDVLLLDRAVSFPRRKICGDGLTPASTRELEELGLLGAASLRSNWVEGGVLYSPSGAHVDMPGTRACVVRRELLDQALLEKAAAAKARVQLGTSVSRLTFESGGAVVSAGTDALRCDLVVLATGSRSSLPILHGLQRPPPADAVARRAYFSQVSWRADRLLFCYARELLPAYGWLFPLGDGVANIGVGSFLGESRASNLAPAFQQFQSWLKREGILAEASKPSEEGTDLLRTGMRGNGLVADRLIAVGDAAAAIDPLSGEGVSQAIRSGRLAAQAAARALSRGRMSAADLSGYRGAMRREFGRRAREARWARWLLRSSRLIESLVSAARVRPGLAHAIYEMLVGEKSPLPTLGHAATALVTTGAWRGLLRDAGGGGGMPPAPGTNATEAGWPQTPGPGGEARR